MLFALPFGIANNYVARSAVTQCERVSCNLLSHAAVAAAAAGVFFLRQCFCCTNMHNNNKPEEEMMSGERERTQALISRRSTESNIRHRI